MPNKTKNFNVCVKVIILIDKSIKNIYDYYQGKKTHMPHYYCYVLLHICSNANLT